MKLTNLLFLLFPCGLFAQNWMPVAPNETYHYRLADSAYITHSIRVDSSKIVGADVVYYLNRVLKYEGPVGDQIAFYKQGQFLGKTMTQKPDGSLVFESGNIFFDTSIVIFPQANLGETWLAVAEDNITASVISIQEGEVVGIQDSLKIIQFSNGAQWVLSKNYGLLSAPDFNQGNLTATLSGLENQELGDRLYRFEDFFEYSVGDVFESQSYFSGQFGWSDTRIKTRILEKTILPEGFQYLVEKKQKTVTGGLSSGTTLSISNEPMLYLRQSYKNLDAYNHQTIVAPFGENQFSFVTHFKHRIQFGNQFSSSDNPEYCSILGISDDPTNPLTFLADALECTLGDNAWVYFYYDEYRYKVGRVKYGYAVIDNSYFEELSGAVIQGDTLWGSVTPDWYFTATAEPTTESKLIATPNPTFGYATLQIPDAVDYGVIQLFSADGRCVRTHDFQNLKLVSLDLTALPTGNYFVILRSEGMIWQAHLAKNSE